MAVLEKTIEAPARITHGDLVVSDGVRIHWMEAGAGVPVVLLHGYTSCCDAAWFANGLAKELARDHRVIGIDARGHGRSDKPLDPAKYPGDRMPADVVEVLDHLNVEKAHFHGYSMGGGILAHLMARHSERFLSASFGGSGVREEDEGLAAQATARDPQGHDPQQAAGQRALRERADRDDEALKCVREGRLAKPSTAPPLDLTAIAFPIQAINGEFDAPVSKTQRLAREARDFTNVVLPGRSHNTVTTWPFTPRLYVEAIAAFVRAHDPK
ncbi:MAG TPA: alpha/beta fold hydrolase [Caulobacteraceae bacterium]|nr:alpha/beta fold hydrolase [Caulobacteraceae bacterium]